jgi:hypothetical protein
MNRFVKTWLLWLMMLALPWQAQASVMQLSCDIGHQQQRGNVAAKGHGIYAKLSPRLKRQGAALGAPHGAKPAKKAIAGAPADMDHACGPCVTCCGASVALPNLKAGTAPRDDSDEYFASLPASHAGFIPEGLERPPRHHFC